MMTIGDFLSDYWWLIFPIFGMYMAVQGSSSQERRTRDAIALLKTYTDQGKEPPAELLQTISKSLDADPDSSGDGKNGTAWSFFLFLALAGGFGAGWYLNQGEGYEWVFLSVCVAMAVLALGALMILIFGRK
jgi:hypothetical protein